MNAKEHYQAGRLTEAVAAASEEVKRHPTDLDRRGLLGELLCFVGELERADLQLDAMGHQDPQLAVGVSLFRQLIRAAQARAQFYAEGRLPEFLDRPCPRLQCHLQASIRLREGDVGEAARLLEEAEQQRMPLAGHCDGEAFEDLRDLDDLTASLFEVLTSTGKYYWIPMERVERIEFRPPERPRDLLWRRALMTVRDGPDGEVFLPTLYAGSHAESDDRLRLGRATDWRGGRDGPTRGVGQRMFLVGEEARGILELQEITVTAPAPGTSHAED